VGRKRIIKIFKDNMALIDKRFVHFKTRNAFNTALAANEISNDSVVFVADEKRIWTHGTWFYPESFREVIVDDGSGENKRITPGVDSLEAAITFLAGDGLNISVNETTGAITYAHNTKTISNITTEAGKFISGITFDQFGHVASVTTSDVEQNTYKNVVANNAADVKAEGAAIANGSVHINTVEHDSIANSDVVTSSILIKGKDDIAVTALADGTIEVGHVLGQGANMTPAASGEPDGDSVYVLNSASVDPQGHLLALGSLPVPTKAYVDSKISNLSGALDTSLLFRGVLGTGTNMIKWEDANQPWNGKDGEERSGSELGDIYKVGSAGTYADQVCQVGDLIICVQTNPIEWVVVQGNADVATSAILGFVKGGYRTSESDRNFAVQIDASGTMWVNVPFEYTNTSESVVTNSATGQETASAGNGEVRINHLETSKNAAGNETTVVKSSVNIKGSDATTVKADADGVITVESHDTKYSMTHSETAKNKTISFLEDGVVKTTFIFDEWHEGE
jgi:hypothetical protein